MSSARGMRPRTGRSRGGAAAAAAPAAAAVQCRRTALDPPRCSPLDALAGPIPSHPPAPPFRQAAVGEARGRTLRRLLGRGRPRLVSGGRSLSTHAVAARAAAAPARLLRAPGTAVARRHSRAYASLPACSHPATIPLYHPPPSRHDCYSTHIVTPPTLFLFPHLHEGRRQPPPAACCLCLRALTPPPLQRRPQAALPVVQAAPGPHRPARRL